MLTAQIEQLGLQNAFILVGAVNNPYPYYTQADLYVHATRFEGKSIAIQEAQTLGCPMVVSDCSGNREQVIQGVGRQNNHPPCRRQKPGLPGQTKRYG